MAWFASWLWEGVVIVLLVSAMLRGLRRVDAATRYAIWWGTLLAIICWPIVTLIRVLAHYLLTAPLFTVPPPATHHSRPLVEVTVPTAPLWALRIVLALWVASVTWKLSRLAVACWQLHRVKRSCAPIDDRAIARLPLWRAASRRGRAAVLCMSDRVDVACALGFRRPMIALPRQFVDQLAPRDLDQVALHEYAHVQRRDDWARLVQLAVDAVCGWHPAVRWISRQLTFEREVACDDWVVQRTHDPLGYARCLTTLAEQTIAGRVSALSPAAWSTEADVVRRVKRVLDARRNPARSASRWRLALAVAVVALCAGEAGRVLALQDATDRIVAATPIGGTLSEATTTEALPSTDVGALTASSASANDAAHARIAARTTFSGAALLPPAMSAMSSSGLHPLFTPSSAHANDASAASANTHAGAAASENEAPVSVAASVPAEHVHPMQESSPGPATPGQSGSTPVLAYPPLDLTATVADMALDDDAEHDFARPEIDQPSHNDGTVHVRPVRTRTRATGFFARVGRSIAHILGTHTRSPGPGTPDAWRRRASRQLPADMPVA